tara:strand:+ start:15698 stop:15868 length:171 start_codon:yes stop_codon:yes gene_type:complete
MEEALSTLVFVNENKGRAVYGARTAKTSTDALSEPRFTASKISTQEDHIASMKNIT